MAYFSFGRSTKSPTPSKKLLTSKSNLFSASERQISTTNAKKNAKPSVQQLRWAFEKFDANKDGKITREEYKAALRILDKDITDTDIAKAFEALDSDGDGSVDFKEFVEMFEMGEGGAKAGDIESAFKLFDIDGDGKISAEELSQVLRKLGEGCSMKDCRNMVKGVDSDGDGYINMEEFTRMMSTSKGSKLNAN